MIVAAIVYASTTTRLCSWTALVGKARSGVEAQSAPPDFPSQRSAPRRKGLRYPCRYDRWRGNTG
jgi:hypothetical protein